MACEQIHSKYTAKYTVSGGGGWQTRESHACTNGQVPIRNTKKLNYLSSSDRLPRSNVGQSCEKSTKTHEIRQKIPSPAGALVGSSGPHRVCILALWEQIHKIHCVFSPSPNTQNTDFPSRARTATYKPDRRCGWLAAPEGGEGMRRDCPKV